MSTFKLLDSLINIGIQQDAGMSTFKLLDSLINPPAVKLVEAEEAAPAQPTEHVTLDDADRKSGYRYGEFDYELAVTYNHPNLQEPLYLLVRAVLNAEYNVEDNSFDYEYGSQRGVHRDVSEVFEDLSWTKVTLPHTESNMDLFKMTPEQVQHVTQVVTNFLTTMDADTIEQHVDIEKLIDLARPEPHFDEPDGDDY